METMVTGATTSFATDKTATCDFLKTPFSHTAPVATNTCQNSFLFMSGLLEYHHLSVAGWAWDLDEGLGVVSDWMPAN